MSTPSTTAPAPEVTTLPDAAVAPAPVTETPEQKEAREREEQAAKQQSMTDPNDMMTKFLMALFSAIFGSFQNTTSEYSEIEQKDAAPRDPALDEKAREIIMTPDVRGKMQALVEKYKDSGLPKNISPFTTDATITSTLGAREQPLPGASKDHQGIDMVPVSKDAEAIKIHNTMPGVVVRSQTQRNANGDMAGYGNWIEVAGIDGKTRRYAHLKERDVKVGDVLDQGAVLGVMGNTGTSEAAHLHYEWRDANAKSLEPIINDTTYARNDRSAMRTTVTASNVTPSTIEVAAAAPTAAAPVPATVAQQVQGLNLPKLDVAEASAGNKSPIVHGTSASVSVSRL